MVHQAINLHLQQLACDRERLLAMAEAARRVARPCATEQVGRECLRLAGLEPQVTTPGAETGEAS